MKLLDRISVSSTVGSGKYTWSGRETSNVPILVFWYSADTIFPAPTEPGRQIMAPDPAELDKANRFRELVERWKADTINSSIVAEMSEHPAYQSIIAMQKPAIPYLMAELERSPDHWFVALQEITNEDPVPDRSRGNVRKMAEAWLRWGREQGYY